MLDKTKTVRIRRESAACYSEAIRDATFRVVGVHITVPGLLTLEGIGANKGKFFQVLEKVLENAPERHVGYLNIYRGSNGALYTGGKFHINQTAAKEGASLGVVARIKIEFEEGEGL